MATYHSQFFKKAPFIRFLLPMVVGIIAQWHFQVNIQKWWVLLFSSLIVTIIFFILPFFKRYKLAFINGLAVNLLFFSLGALLAWQKDIRNNDKWLGNYYENNNGIVAVLNEPPVEKTKSLKADVIVSHIIKNDSIIPATGKIIVYFKKDSTLQLSYGTTILLKKPLQEIKNSGNPGGFDYKRYSLFHDITHQVYLTPEEFEILPERKENWLRKFIFSTREKVLSILRRNIKVEKELGLAEALLIGYKDDLDQKLVQSYTNTGVVHIIAISGLHLGLIYWLLARIFNPLRKRKKIKWLRPIFVITGLWLFALLAGAQPSVLRSALMFTFIVLGEAADRKTSIYNSLAVSAFLLLCINPYWLWDVGFQLSYAAVISIVTFMRPIYNWFYIKNKLLDFLWKLNSVTIAAQVLTIPLSIYHFHQFPTLFLLTNFIAVPFASMILISEILLCGISFIPFLATLVGKILSALIWFMNTYVERIETIRYSLWDGLQISLPQMIFLILFSTGIAAWLMEKWKKGLMIGLASLLLFIISRSYSFVKANGQQKIIVYNVPQKRAIDFVNGRNYSFVGDSDLLVDGFARNFHLKPSRILYRIEKTNQLNHFYKTDNYVNYYGKNILLVNEPVSFTIQEPKPKVDLLVISKNPRIYINQLASSLDIKQVVFDGSVPAWKSNYWKKDCDSLHIPWWDVIVKGAFVMDVR